MEREIEWQAFGQTVVHPLSLAFTLAMGIWLLRVRRDRAVLPVMLVHVPSEGWRDLAELLTGSRL